MSFGVGAHFLAAAKYRRAARLRPGRPRGRSERRHPAHRRSLRHPCARDGDLAPPSGSSQSGLFDRGRSLPDARDHLDARSDAACGHPGRCRLPQLGRRGAPGRLTAQQWVVLCLVPRCPGRHSSRCSDCDRNVDHGAPVDPFRLGDSGHRWLSHDHGLLRLRLRFKFRQISELRLSFPLGLSGLRPVSASAFGSGRHPRIDHRRVGAAPASGNDEVAEDRAVAVSIGRSENGRSERGRHLDAATGCRADTATKLPSNEIRIFCSNGSESSRDLPAWRGSRSSRIVMQSTLRNRAITTIASTTRRGWETSSA